MCRPYFHEGGDDSLDEEELLSWVNVGEGEMVVVVNGLQEQRPCWDA